MGEERKGWGVRGRVQLLSIYIQHYTGGTITVGDERWVRREGLGVRGRVQLLSINIQHYTGTPGNNKQLMRREIRQGLKEGYNCSPSISSTTQEQ